MDLKHFVSDYDLIMALSERIQNKYPPNPKGFCAPMTKDLQNELAKNGIKSKRIEGIFILDEPDAEDFVTMYGDEYEVPHDWLEMEGKILDISAKMFRKSVHQKIPDIVYIGYTSPLYSKYK